MIPNDGASRAFYARFPAGFGPVVERRLLASSYGVIDLWDEACVFSARDKIDKRTAGLFSAVYGMIDRIEASARTPSAETLSMEFARRLRASRRVPPGMKTRGFFRVRVLLRNGPVSLRSDALAALEDAFSASSGLRVDRRGSSGELCVLIREDGEAFLLYRDSTADPLPSPFGEPGPGELPARTARLLCECSSPRDDDLFLDPFAGGGSIPFHRALMAPFRLVFAQEIDPERYALMRTRLASKALARHKKRIFPKNRDARDLSGFEDASVTAIVADPPWGHWEGGQDGETALETVTAFLVSARRVLAPEGRMVLLVSREMAGSLTGGEDSPLRAYRGLERLDVLVSGRKATVLVLA